MMVSAAPMRSAVQKAAFAPSTALGFSARAAARNIVSTLPRWTSSSTEAGSLTRLLTGDCLAFNALDRRPHAFSPVAGARDRQRETKLRRDLQIRRRRLAKISRAGGELSP